jgi:hypothetical protein
MEALSIIALILITLAAYSAGVALGTGKGAESKPGIADILIMLALWTAALASRSVFHFGKWLSIPIWLVLGLAAGGLAGLVRRPVAKKPAEPDPVPAGGAWTRAWGRWKAFSLRMGSFQSRIILSLIYFIFILPFGLGVRLFSDPMLIRKKKVPSYWLPKREFPATLDEFKRQS